LAGSRLAPPVAPVGPGGGRGWLGGGFPGAGPCFLPCFGFVKFWLQPEPDEGMRTKTKPCLPTPHTAAFCLRAVCCVIAQLVPGGWGRGLGGGGGSRFVAGSAARAAGRRHLALNITGCYDVARGLSCWCYGKTRSHFPLHTASHSSFFLLQAFSPLMKPAHCGDRSAALGTPGMVGAGSLQLMPHRCWWLWLGSK
jgi:hypothetical protein